MWLPFNVFSVEIWWFFVQEPCVAVWIRVFGTTAISLERIFLVWLYLCGIWFEFCILELSSHFWQILVVIYVWFWYFLSLWWALVWCICGMNSVSLFEPFWDLDFRVGCCVKCMVLLVRESVEFCFCWNLLYNKLGMNALTWGGLLGDD